MRQCVGPDGRQQAAWVAAWYGDARSLAKQTAGIQRLRGHPEPCGAVGKAAAVPGDLADRSAHPHIDPGTGGSGIANRTAVESRLRARGPHHATGRGPEFVTATPLGPGTSARDHTTRHDTAGGALRA